MTILYLSYDGMTDQLGQSQVLPYLTGLAAKGHDIHLISCEKNTNFQKAGGMIARMTEEEHITWHPLKYHKSPPVISTLYDIRNIQKKAFELCGKYRFDIVHCRSYISAFVGLHLKEKSGVKFIFDMRGFYPDERVDGKIWNLKNPVYANIYRFFKKKEKQFLTNADHIISLTHAAEKIIQSWKLKGSEHLPVTVIPCCADLMLFDYHRYDSDTRRSIREKLCINQETFVLTYLGAIGTWYMLEEMLAFFKQLLITKKDAVFLFITHEKPGMIEQHAMHKQIPVSQLRIVYAQRIEVPLYLSATDVSIFFIIPSFSKKASSPTKQAELMGMGIPVICNAGVGDSDYIVNVCHSGIVLQNFGEKDFENAIKKIENPEDFSKEIIRQGAQQFYSLEGGIESYQKIYQSLKTC